ncbi:MAG: NADP-dependent isocitrate dehydrogenase [Deltaproteobacteria bacterium]|nr:MAG: NADP-dependent isocitrate dehydrogenase [Deltaproteobacteria bacterium]
MNGELITMTSDGNLVIPDFPIIPFIEGDGVGRDIWPAAQTVFDEAVKRIYGETKRVFWREVLAGEKAMEKTGNLLPEETLEAIRQCRIAIKGPLTTPVGKGFRSLNVTLRKHFDLYTCIRPVRYFEGVISPMKNPEKLDVVIFRENVEDVYAGLEWPKGSAEARKLIEVLGEAFGWEIPGDAGIGIKFISEGNTKRFVRRAFDYAIKHRRKSVTFIHKGNIMKYTEGAFREWAYQVAREVYGDLIVMEEELDGNSLPEGKIVVKDRIADAMFQLILLRPEEYDVLVLPNLNGDYLSDACAAQVGGIGMAPGANIGDEVAIFEATHGSAPKYAGQDKVNPSSLILSGAMMFDFMGWGDVAHLIERGVEMAVKGGKVTYDLARFRPDAVEVSCSEFAREIVSCF